MVVWSTPVVLPVDDVPLVPAVVADVAAVTDDVTVEGVGLVNADAIVLRVDMEALTH
jgi:hypothetical protein